MLGWTGPDITQLILTIANTQYVKEAHNFLHQSIPYISNQLSLFRKYISSKSQAEIESSIILYTLSGVQIQIVILTDRFLWRIS